MNLLLFIVIPKVEETLTLAGETSNREVLAAVNQMLDQLVWYAEAIKKKKERDGLRCEECFDDTNLGYKGLPFSNRKWA